MNEKGFVYPVVILGLIVISGLLITLSLSLDKTADLRQQYKERIEIKKRIFDQSEYTPYQTGETFTESSNSSNGINPTELIGDAEDISRKNSLLRYMSALRYYESENGDLPEGITTIPKPISKSGVDLCSILIPRYEEKIYLDPTKGKPNYINDCSKDYDTGFMISVNDYHITLSAPLSKGSEPLSITQ